MTNEQSVIDLRMKGDSLKESYLTALKQLVVTNDTDQEPTLNDILECQQLGNLYFNAYENFVGESEILKAHTNEKWILGFAEDCAEILNTYLNHIKFLNSYQNFHNLDTVPSKYAYANMQRIVKEYLPKNDTKELQTKFEENHLSTYGFKIQNTKNSKKIQKKWESLSMRQKISLIGSIASIIGLSAIFLPSNAESTNQTSYGNQSPNIQAEENSTVNINNTPVTNNYYVEKIEKDDNSYVLEKTLLFLKPSLDIKNTKKKLCFVENGTSVKLLSEKNDDEINGAVWIKVKILNGTCKGTIGWTGKDKLIKK